MSTFDYQPSRGFPGSFVLCAVWCLTLACVLPCRVPARAAPRLVYNDDGFNFLGSGDELTVTLADKEADLTGKIELVELELLLGY